ncbi:MAG: glycosyltransferase family 4 protein [Candidatus Sericytochromatia bacterium]|nr:glycosyltransferase family 4 protein [Candidatus Sericytochromatia bacterium]
MRVLTLSWEYPPRVVGGLARHVEELSEAQVKAGTEVHVVTFPHPNTPDESTPEGVHVHRVGFPDVKAPDFLSDMLDMNMRLMSRAFALHQEQPFDLIHAHDWLVAHAAVGLKRALGLPLVVTIHATESGRNQGIEGPLQTYIHQMEWLANYESWRTIVCSHAMQRELMRLFKVPADKLDIIPNGVKGTKLNTDFDRAALRSRFAHESEPIIMSVGRMVAEKGIGVLVAATPRVLERHPNARFVICGKGPGLEEYRHLAHALGVADRVHFTGYIDDDTLYQLFQVSDAAVFPSLYEPFGIVALEGMAAGKATIVSDVGGMAEIIQDGVNGLEVAPDDPGALAHAIHRVLSDINWGNALGTAGRRDTEQIYNWDLIAAQTADVYAKVMGDQPKG